MAEPVRAIHEASAIQEGEVACQPPAGLGRGSKWMLDTGRGLGILAEHSAGASFSVSIC